MKEFQYKNGGRRLYNEDIDRLQELSLAFNAILAGAKLNIVLSGCNVRRTLSTGYSTKYNIEVSAGYAYINGKVRDVPSYSVNDVPTSYVPAIVANNITSGNAVTYADGSSAQAYHNYTAAVRIGAAEDFSDAVVFDIERNKFPDMEDFITRYAVGRGSNEWKNLMNGVIPKNGGELNTGASLTFTDRVPEKKDDNGNIIQEAVDPKNYTTVGPTGVEMEQTVLNHETNEEYQGTAHIGADRFETDGPIIAGQQGVVADMWQEKHGKMVGDIIKKPRSLSFDTLYQQIMFMTDVKVADAVMRLIKMTVGLEDFNNYQDSVDTSTRPWQDQLRNEFEERFNDVWKTTKADFDMELNERFTTKADAEKDAGDKDKVIQDLTDKLADMEKKVTEFVTKCQDMSDKYIALSSKTDVIHGNYNAILNSYQSLQTRVDSFKLAQKDDSASSIDDSTIQSNP